MENERNHENHLQDKVDGVRLKSDREKAIEWWNKKNPYDEQHSLKDKYYGENRTVNSLTGSEIEQIWRKETQELLYENQSLTSDAVYTSKPDQKQFQIGDVVKCIISIPFHDNTGNKNIITEDNIEWFNTHRENYILVSNAK